MNGQRNVSFLAGPGVMLISALLFGYFGFTTSFNYQSTITGEFLLFVALLDWTLKGSAIVFAVAAAVTFVQPFFGNLLYTVASLLGAIMFVVVVIMDVADTRHTVFSPILLLVFAAWNGYGSWSSLRALLGTSAMTLERPPEA